MQSGKDLRPTANIIGAVNEVYQVILFSNLKYGSSNKEQSAPKITVSVRCLDQTTQTGLHLFRIKIICSESVPYISLLKENCLPGLCKFICEMQTDVEDSHMALRTAVEHNYRLQRTVLLRLESDPETNIVTVHILSEAITEVKDEDHISTVLEIRAFMQMSDIIHSSKGIIDLMERIKFLSPKVHLSFTLHSLTSVQVDLCDTGCIFCENFEIYSGCDLFIGNNTEFLCQELKVQPSKMFEFKIKGKDSLTETICLTCISCFVPICASESAADNNSDGLPCDEQDSKKLHVPGQVRIQVYGPGGLPFDMCTVTEKLTLTPESLLSWQKFGLQVKKSYSCSSYDLRCSARIADRDVVPSWATMCHHFCLMLVFVLNPREDSFVGNATICRQQELFRCLEQQVFNREAYHIFQDTASSSLTGLFPQDTQKTTLSEKAPNSRRQTADSDIFKKMIPEVVNSLTDIFIKSTHMDFRSQVASLIPTSSRITMSSHLEKALKKMIYNPVHDQEDSLSQDLVLDSADESQVDEWDMSKDSLLSVQEDEAMSPDSLDVEWDSVDSTTLSQYKSPAREARESFPAIVTSHYNTAEDNSLNSCRPSLSELLPSHFKVEKAQGREQEVWEQCEDALISDITASSCLWRNATPACFSLVSQQHHTDNKSLLSTTVTEENSASKCLSQLGLSSGYLRDHTDECFMYKGTYPAAEKMPRKRSSEYIDDTVIVDNAGGIFNMEKHSVFSYTNTALSDIYTENKKQRLQLSEVLNRSEVSDSDWPDRFCCRKADECNNTGYEPNNIDQAEDVSSECWFDEEQIADWQAELDK